MKQTLYVLVVDQAWAKLYLTVLPVEQLRLVYHQALFGGRPASTSADQELARSLCRILRAERLTGKYTQLVMLASDNMLAALRIQYDGEWRDVTLGPIANLPNRYTDEDLAEHVKWLLARAPLEERTPQAASGNALPAHD